jgi:hypothetical protein
MSKIKTGTVRSGRLNSLDYPTRQKIREAVKAYVEAGGTKTVIYRQLAALHKVSATTIERTVMGR